MNKKLFFIWSMYRRLYDASKMDMSPFIILPMRMSISRMTDSLPKIWAISWINELGLLSKISKLIKFYLTPKCTYQPLSPT